MQSKYLTDRFTQESKQKTIELKDDDPTALTNVLRHIYKLPLAPDPTGMAAWRVWHSLRTTADKYLEPRLSAAADSNFRASALATKDSNTIFDIMEIIKDEMAHEESLVEFAERLRKENIGKLLKNDRFRAQLDQSGKEAMWQQIDELIFAADLATKRYHLCFSHTKYVFQEPSLGANEMTTPPCRICDLRNSHGQKFFSLNAEQQLEGAAWVPK